MSQVYFVFVFVFVFAAGGGLVARLPVRGAFVAFLCVCTSVPALSWGQYRLDMIVCANPVLESSSSECAFHYWIVCVLWCVFTESFYGRKCPLQQTLGGEGRGHTHARPIPPPPTPRCVPANPPDDCTSAGINGILRVQEWRVYIVPRTGLVQKCKSTELYKSPPNGQPKSTRPIDIVPRTGVADTCQTHYGQTGPTLHA